MTQSILAIDDEIHMLRLLERIIREKTPYQISTTNVPLEAQKILETNQFDLVITDLKMPGLDGLDILGMIKERKMATEVIIITAFGSLETAIEALSRGVFDYITKPFKKEQIIFTVDRAMKFQNMRREIEKLSAILSIEPFEDAMKAFRKEYCQRLASKYGGNEQIMVERSRLSPEIIGALIRGIEPKEI